MNRQSVAAAAAQGTAHGRAVGQRFRASDGTMYVVAPDGSFRRYTLTANDEGVLVPALVKRLSKKERKRIARHLR